MGSLSEVVNGYASLASSILERWNDLAARAAAEVEDGEYGAACAAEDLATGAWLATVGGLEWAEQTCEALETLVGFEDGPASVTSQPFPAPAGANLEMGPTFQIGPGLEYLLPADIRIEWLNDGEFVLRADAAERRGGTYFGQVIVVTENAERIPQWVWISIP